MRRDRDSGPGGGVSIYFKANLTAYLVTRWNCTHLEAAWLNVTIRSQSFLIGCIYRPPQDSLFFNHFRNVLENIWLRRKNIILSGDFNSDMLKGSSKTESQYGKRLKRIISSFGLKNIMSCPSRVTLTSKSLIDLVITSQPAKVKNSGAIDLGISDHNLVFAVFMTTRVNPKPKYITNKAYKSLNIKQFRNDMEHAPWQLAGIFDDVDDSLYLWDYLYKDIVNHHLPTRKLKIRCKSLPWNSTYIRKQINLRYKLLKEAKSSQDQVKWELYKSKGNEVKKLLRQSEAAYWKQEFMNSKDPKQFWKLTNKVLRKSKDSTIGPIITDSKDVLTSDLEKASYFNEFFINISEELTKNLEPLDPKTLTSYVTRVTPTRCDIELNWELVKKKIEKSSMPNEATGPDLVSPKDLKLLGVSSIHSLLPIFKKSIDDTVFPTNWKLSRVKPVLKKGAPTDMSNFRPISLLRWDLT